MFGRAARAAPRTAFRPYRRASNSSAPSGGSAGFTSRPYLFQARFPTLLARIAAGDDEWDGTESGSPNNPQGFGTLMASAYASSGRGTVDPYGTGWSGSYNDIPTYQIALYAALTGNGTAAAIAKAEALAWIRAQPDGIWGAGTGDSYQRIDDDLMNTVFVVDCTFSLWSAGELTEARTYLTGVMTNALAQTSAFWPGEDPHNNYWNNQHYATAIASICAEGWGGSALTTWRARFQDMCNTFVTKYNPSTWISGQPSITEGMYYAAYRRRSLEALRLSDYFFGTTWFAQSNQSAQTALNTYFFMMKGDMSGFFHYGAEAAATGASWDFNKREHINMLMELVPTSSEAQLMKQIITTIGPETYYLWGRSLKNWGGFLYSTRAIGTVGLTSKTDRMLSMPGGSGPYGLGWTAIRSSNGWNIAAGAANIRSGIVWHGGQPAGVGGAAYSHANPDSPGLQWTQGGAWLVADPEYNSDSGVEAQAGVPTAAFQSNIVGLASSGAMPTSGQCAALYIEDNTGGSIPHYYMSINAQPMWTAATTYRRQYVWLDDLQVVVIHDHIVTSGSDTKTWRLHVHGTVSIASGVATITTATGGYTMHVRDLYATSGGTMTSAAPSDIAAPTANMNRISQTDTANDYRSLKVLDVNNRCTAATLSSGAGYLQADMTINGVSRSVRFFDDTTHVTVS